MKKVGINYRSKLGTADAFVYVTGDEDTGFISNNWKLAPSQTV